MGEHSVKQTLEVWVDQVEDFFTFLAEIARKHGWTPTFNVRQIREEPVSLKKKINYDIKELTLTKVDPQGNEFRIVFEPRHRYTIGAAGRIDVYSYPALRELMLLRIVNEDGVENMTWEQIEQLIVKTPWTAYTSDGIPLRVDFQSESEVQYLLSSLTD